MEEIFLISADKDGAELARARRKHRYHLRCDGRGDEAAINEAIESVGRGRMWSISPEAWERVFGQS